MGRRHTAISPLIISTRDRWIQLKFLHRMYYSPQRHSTIYPLLDPTCPKCRMDVGTFIHMVWSCCTLKWFWSEEVSELSALSGLVVPIDPLVLLGICDTLNTIHHNIYFCSMHCIMLESLFSLIGSCLLPLRYSSGTPLSYQLGVAFVYSKPTYLGNNCLKKFNKIGGLGLKVRT